MVQNNHLSANNAAPFDVSARDYDATFTNTKTGRLQRDLVWSVLKRWYPAKGGVQVKDCLEINCGTGEDAIWLQQQGYHVWATDVSEAMLRVAQEKVAAAGLSGAISIGRLDLHNLTAEQHKLSDYDLIFSNFGGLNCMSPDDIRQMGAVFKGHLRPGGRLVLVVMGRFCWWETLYFIAKGRFSTAFRRRSKPSIDAHLQDNKTLPIWYYSPSELAKLLPDYVLAKTEPIGVVLPPSYLDRIFCMFPIRVQRFLTRIEWGFRAGWMAGVADHFVVELLHSPKPSLDAP